MFLAVPVWAQTDLFELVRTGNAEAVEQALQGGVDMDLLDAEGLLPIDVALRSEQMDCVTPLLKAGMEPDRSMVYMIEYYRQMGELAQAKVLADSFLLGEHREVRPPDPTLVLARAYKGLILLDQGDPGKAIQLMLEARDQSLELYGPESLPYGARLNNLGLAYQALYQWEDAIQAFRQALDIFRHLTPDDSENLVTLMENLALATFSAGRQEEGLALLQEAKELYEEKIGREDLNYSFRLNNLGFVYFKMGRYLEAIPLFRQAIRIILMSLGQDHPHVTTGYYNLAQTSRLAGLAEEAHEWYQKALEACGLSYGEDHQEYGWILSGMAMNLWSMGRLPETGLAMHRLDRNLRYQMADRLPYLNEALQETFAMDIQLDLDRITSFLLAHPEEASWIGEHLENRMFIKGALLDQKERFFGRLHDGNEKDLKSQFQRWLDLHVEIADESGLPLLERGRDLDSLVQVADELELLLVNRLPEFGNERQWVTWNMLRDQLGSHEVFLAFDQIRESQAGQNGQEIRYLAWIWMAGSDRPRLVPLCLEGDLEKILDQNVPRKADYVARLYSAPDRGFSPVEQEQPGLYDLIWKPLEGEIGHPQGIWMTMSGLLHRINPGAIPIDRDSTLSDRHDLHVIGQLRSFVQDPEAHRLYWNQDAILFGGARYDMDSLAIMQAIEAPVSSGPAGEEIVAISDRGGNGTWSFLRGSLQEVEAIDQVLELSGYNVEIRRGFAASEDQFKWLGQIRESPGIIHLATHGYFVEKVDEEGELPGVLPNAVQGRNPLLRSGVLLTGADHAWSGNSPVAGIEDGILSALEICQMDLRGTQLVVLSACETGLGEIRGSEGVYGLQRALTMAGVRYILMSLWQVPDRQTKDLMVAFYTRWLQDGLTIPEAFHLAQQEMRERYIDPYAWAGFILLE